MPATYLDSAPLPYRTSAAVRFDDQAEFHVRKYLLALTHNLSEAGCRIYENTRALGVNGGVVKTPGGRVSADRVVVATHYPILDRSLAFARVHRPALVRARLPHRGHPPEGMFISGDSPTRSVRAVPVDGEELLLVGGEGHGTGTGGNTEERYQRLERFAREHWDVESVEYRWSSQDNVTSDGIPYVGRLTPRNERLSHGNGLRQVGAGGRHRGRARARGTCARSSHRWARLTTRVA